MPEYCRPTEFDASMLTFLQKFLRNTQGGVSLLFGLALPVLAGLVALALDTSHWTKERGLLQVAADSAALAAVREFSLPGTDTRRIELVARQFAAGQLGALAEKAKINAVADARAATVAVTITRTADSLLAGMVNISGATIGVRATARMVGSPKICLIALDPTNGKTISVSKTAKLTAKECSVFANSTDSQALSVKDNALLTAASICSSGGTEGGSQNFRPAPRVDCPVIRDPLAMRPPPTVGACDFTDKVVDRGSVILMPGVYCGGLKVTNNATARLRAGIYVIKNGKLIVDATATLEGTDVGFYMTGGSAQFEFDKATTISLAAPKSGAMAGLLFFEDRAAALGSKHAILSNNAHTLLGTIYLPRGMLHIDAEAPISNRAAYTIIVTNQIELISGPELFLNANYGSSTVPVPAGVGPLGSMPVLER